MAPKEQANPAEEPRHPIQVVARRTGLSADVIRAWERRHQAVEPARSDTSRRLYTDADVERLLLLRRATLAGRRIGDVATLPTRELRVLVERDEFAAARAPHGVLEVPDSPVAQSHLAGSLEALKALDAVRFEAVLSSGALALSPIVLIEKLLAPLMRQVGDSWGQGSMRIGHEHMATAIVRALLNSLRHAHGTPSAGPDIVATTPSGHRHELGALMAGVAAAAAGWRVSYLGPDTPAGEIAAVASYRKARAVALSLVYPEADPAVEGEVRDLRRQLPGDAVLFAGGSGAESYDTVLREVGAVRLTNTPALQAQLLALR